MNKKIIALVLVFALAVCSVFASSTTGTSKKDGFSLGVGLGTNTGVAVKYGMGKFDFQGDVGIKFMGGFGFSGDLGAYYNVYDITFKTDTFSKTQCIPLTVGPVVALSVTEGQLGLDVLAVLGAEYTWSKVPVTMFLKLGGGLGLTFTQDGVGTGGKFYGVVGALYNF